MTASRRCCYQVPASRPERLDWYHCPALFMGHPMGPHTSINPLENNTLPPVLTHRTVRENMSQREARRRRLCHSATFQVHRATNPPEALKTGAHAYRIISLRPTTPFTLNIKEMSRSVHFWRYAADNSPRRGLGMSPSQKDL